MLYMGWGGRGCCEHCDRASFKHTCQILWKRTVKNETIYCVTGTTVHGEPSKTTAPNKASALRSVDDLNRSAVKRGAEPDWKAFEARIEWKPIS